MTEVRMDLENAKLINTGTGKAATLTASAMMAEQFAYNASGLAEYVGIAKIGTGSGEGKWAIKKLIYSGTNVVQIQWGSASGDFIHIWNNRASNTYG